MNDEKLPLYFLIFFFLYIPTMNAKDLFGSLKGIVVDIRTKQPVVGACISMWPNLLMDTTDSNGGFSFYNVLVGFYDIEVVATQYQKRVFPSVIIKSGVNKDCVLEIEYSENLQELEKIVVASKVTTKKVDQTNSTKQLSRDEVLNSPGAWQDVNLVIQLMPSALGGMDGGNDFVVRGGDISENIFLIDGIEVKNLSHWGTEYTSGGIISILHAGFIDNLDFYAGGVPSQYPPQLSSITDIHFREGSKTDYIFQIDMSAGGIGFFCEGPIIKNQSSFLVNARISFLELLERFIDAGGLPRNQNGQIKLTWHIGNNDKIITSLLLGHETIKIIDSDFNEELENEGKHAVGGLQWVHLGDRGINTLLFSGKYNSFFEMGTRNDSIRTRKWNNYERTFQLKENMTIFIRELDVANIGFTLERKQQKDIQGNDFYYICVDPDSSYHFYLHKPDNVLMLIDSIDQLHLNEKETGYRIGGYANYTFFRKNLKINIGMRNDYFTLSKKHGPSPRAGVSLDLNRTGAFSLSGGLYYQFPSYIDYVDDSIFLWDVELQRNYQVVAGYDKQFSDVVVLGIEAYYKYYDREPIYSLIPEKTNSSIGKRVIEVNPDHYSKKKAYGLELYLHKKKLDKFYYQVSYSLFNVLRLYENGKWYNDDYNLRNSLKMIIGSNFHRCHRISLRMDLSEGFPYTQIDKTASDAYKKTLYTIGDGWNVKRRDIRTKLSLRYDATFYLKWGNITGYIEVENMLNQRDVFFEYYSIGEFFPEGKIVYYLSRGFIPMGGFTVEF